MVVSSLSLLESSMDLESGRFVTHGFFNSGSMINGYFCFR